MMKNKINFFIIIGIFFILVSTFVSGGICCEKTEQGDYCSVVDDESKCDNNYNMETDVSSCDDTSIEGCVSQGICIDNENLLCSTPKKVSCEDSELNWFGEYTECEEKPKWEFGCCVVKGKADYMRKIECIKNTPNEYDLDFRNAEDSGDCDEIEIATDIGACVDVSGECDYPVTREGCDQEFFEGMDCTNESLRSYGVFCEYERKGCCLGGMGCDLEQISNEDVFKIDTCGNIMKGLPSGGDCKEGEEICGSKEGEIVCKSLNCDVNGDGDYNDPEDMKNGESICVRDGNGGISPGSEHWKKTCIQGEIDFDLCGNGGRDRICIQEKIKEDGKEKRSAYCVPNYPNSCFKITSDYYDLLNSETTNLFENIGDQKSVFKRGKLDHLGSLVDETFDDMEIECNSNPYCNFHEYAPNRESDGTRDKKGLAFFDIAVCLPKYPKNRKSCSILDENFDLPVVFYDPGWDGYHRGQLVVNWKGIEYAIERGYFDEINKFCSKIGDCGYTKNYNGNNGQLVFSYEYDGIWGPYKHGFKKDTRKYFEDLGVYSESGNSFIGLWNDEDVSESKLDLSMKEDSLKPSILSKTGGGYSYNNFKLGGFEAARIDNPEKSKEEIISMLLENKYDKGSGSITTRSDITYGLQKWDFVRKWQREQDEWFGSSSYLFGDAGEGGERTIISSGRNIQIYNLKYYCPTWKRPSGGSKCDKCNPEDPKKETPCTEYKCKSLGTNCKFIDSLTTGPLCIGGKSDGKVPKIEEVVYNGEDYEIEEEGKDKWKIAPKGNSDCFKTGEKMKFNFSLDKLSQCRYEFGPTPDETYEDMNNILDKWEENFAFEIETPLIESVEIIESDNKFWSNISIRCMDSEGDAHIDQKIIKYCIIEKPDEEPPQLEKFNPKNNKNYPYNPGNITIEMDIKERKLDKCKYSYGKGFTEQEFMNSKNYMFCSGTTDNPGHYICSKEMKKGEKEIYFACNDTKGNLNLNIGPYQYSVSNSEISREDWIKQNGLKINSVSFGIEGDTYRSGDEIVLKEMFDELLLQTQTEGGSKNGKANCSRSSIKESKGELGRAVNKFKNTDSTTHSQPLSIVNGGEYFVKIKCSEELSSKEKIVNFSVVIDTSHPQIIENKTEAGEITLITDEPAKCSYNHTSSSFDLDEGTFFEETGLTKEHTTTYNPSATYYIICEDNLGNKGLAGTIGEGEAVGPIIVGSYYLDNKLKVATDRIAKCYYGINKCPSESEMTEDNVMSSDLTKLHSLEWSSGLNYHIRCKDEFGNKNRNCKQIIPISIYE